MTSKTKIQGTMIIKFEGQINIQTQTDLPLHEFEDKMLKAFMNRPASALDLKGEGDMIIATAQFIPTKL